MTSKNFTQHIGNIGKDIELHYTLRNVPVVSFPLIVIDKYKSQDGLKERVTQVSVVAYDKVAEEFVGKTKGTKVLIEGRIQNRKDMTMEIVVQNFTFIC